MLKQLASHWPVQTHSPEFTYEIIASLYISLKKHTEDIVLWIYLVKCRYLTNTVGKVTVSKNI